MKKEVTRWAEMLNAILRADTDMHRGNFYETRNGLEAAIAINDFLRGESCHDMIDEIASNIGAVVREDGTWYFAEAGE